MSELFKEYEIADFFCLRTPTFPVNYLNDLDTLMCSSNIKDPGQVAKLLEVMFDTSGFLEAIYVSSKELHSRWLAEREAKYLNKDRALRLLRTLYKFYSRMSHRCTPYGIFAGVSIGTILDDKTSTNLSTDWLQSLSPTVRLNVHLLLRYIRNIDPLTTKHKSSLKYKPNETAYYLFNKLYYIEKTELDGNVTSKLTSITKNDFVDAIINQAKLAGGITVAEAISLIDLPEVTDDQKEDFVAEVIKSQILLHEYYPTTATKNCVADFISSAESSGRIPEDLKDLKKLHALFESVRNINDINNLISNLNDEINIPLKFRDKDLFRINLEKTATNINIKATIVREITQQALELFSVTTPSTPPGLLAFIQKFASRYEGMEVPLLTALDPNLGIGYAGVTSDGAVNYSPLTAGVAFSQKTQLKPVHSRVYRMAMLRKKAMHTYLNTKQRIVSIDEDIADWIKDSNPQLEARTIVSSYIFGSLLAKNADALDRGDYKFKANQLNAPYAAKLIARFCPLNSKIHAKVEELTNNEQSVNGNLVLAEVLHIPDSKYADISLFPPLRKYEIPYLSSSSSKAIESFPTQDLLVSYRNGKLWLRSKKLDKYVIPCLTNTYDVKYGTPLYQFLSDVSYQNISHGFVWGWGDYYHNESFYPRIMYKKIILSRATWRIEKFDGSMESWDKSFKKFALENNLPISVILAEGDNELLINTENPICRELLYKENKKKALNLKEYLRGRENCWIDNGDHSYTNEVIFPINATCQMYKQDENNYATERFQMTHVQRTFPPGSEWQYFKIYGSTKLLDDLLGQVIYPLISKTVNERIIDNWFFIRYSDPQYHLRVRIHRSGHTGSNNIDWLSFHTQLCEKINAYTKSDMAVTVRLGTYRRELERYSPNNMLISEELFCIDSETVAKITNFLGGDEGEEWRWKIALVTTDLMLDAFGLDLVKKLRLMSSLRTSFFNEFSSDTMDEGLELNRSLRKKYRQYRGTLNNLFDYTNPDERLDGDIIKLLLAKGKRYQLLAEKLKFSVGDSYASFIASHIHMALNRLFIAEQRKFELIIYSLLNQYYESLVARSGTNPKLITEKAKAEL